MIFNSLNYVVFLLVVLPIYYNVGLKNQNRLLLAASYLFYGWWDWRFCSLLAISTVVDFFVAKAIPKAEQKGKKRLLLVSIFTNLGILGFFKYFNFFRDSAALLMGTLGLQADWPTLNIILPMGISFYTFQTMSYTIDVYRGGKPTEKFLPFALYVCFFPQLVAGPIERASNLLPALENPRQVSGKQWSDGLFLIITGLFRKIVIADTAAAYANKCFSSPGTYPSLGLLIGLYLFSFQIYADFSGYSAVARGSAKLLGIDLMVNFRQPYFSTSITEFWRRWHISLSSWLRDYLYISLGGNRHGIKKTYRNLMITMLLGGLWHGASWTFVVWGGLHGVYLALHKYYLDEGKEKRPNQKQPRWPSLRNALCMFATFNLVALSWIFFRAADFSNATAVLGGILTFRGPLLAMGNPNLVVEPILALLLILACTFLIDYPAHRNRDVLAAQKWPWVPRGFLYAFVICGILLYSGGDDIPFIYFQF